MMFPDLTRDDVFRIETARLWLRWPTAKDVPAIVRLAGERAVAETTARIPHPLERGAAEAFVLGARRSNTEGRGLTLALCPRAQPGSLIGIVSIERQGEDPAAHLGYWLGCPAWGSGLTSEATDALIHAFFAYAGGQRLEASALTTNPASRRVIEKGGFVWIGRGTQPFPARGGDREVDRFRLDRGRWMARRDEAAAAPGLAAAC